MTTHALPQPQRTARVAGLLYLVIILSGVASGVIRTTIPPAELPFRLGILLDVAMALADVGIGVLLYFLLRPVSRVLSTMALAFRLAQAAGIGLNLLNLVLASRLAAEGNPLADTFLVAHGVGYDLTLFFFAVNCFLTGALVFRADFFPKVLGVMVGLSGFVYLVGSTLQVVAPELGEAFAAAYGFALLSELAFCGYLMVRGVRDPDQTTSRTSAPVFSPVRA